MKDPEYQKQSWAKRSTLEVLQYNCKLNYRAIVTKTAWQWHKHRHEDQWNRIEIKPHNYIHLIFNKGAKVIHWRKHSLFNKLCRENWLSTCKRLKLDPYLSPWIKINFSWIKDFNVRPEILKLLQKKQGKLWKK
jgi:hypothetical protein